MRVLHLIKAAGIAGAERHLLDLLPGLRANGIDAQFLLLTPPGDAAQPLIEAAHSRDIPTQTVHLPHNASPSALMALVRALRASQPDIVHTHLIHADLYGTLAAKLAGVKRLISSRHNDDPRRARPPLRWLDHALFKSLETAVCISHAVKRAGLAAGLPDSKLRVIHYGLPPVPRREPQAVRAALRQTLDLTADALVVGMLCRLIDAKGITYALDGFSQVASAYPTAHFAIAGDGPLRAALGSQADALGLGGRVTFMGWQDDPLGMAAGLDVLLAPSLREGFGLNLLEAMSQAVPILGSTASALPEIIVNGETGLTVPPADAGAIAGGLRILLADAGLRQRMGEAGLVRLGAHFSAETMLQAHIALYGR